MNFKYLIITVCTLSFLSHTINADNTITNPTLGISAYLPDNWVATPVGDSCMLFSDTTYTYRSQIACKKYTINTTDYAAAGDWTRSHFIAYLMVTQYSYDPFGAVLYFDSSATCKQDSLWAPEVFSEFYSLDTTLDSWNEYTRYTETGNYGYEIYAIGDTADMKMNIGMYMGMIRMMHIDKQTNQTTTLRHKVPHSNLVIAKSPVSSGVFDLLGKHQGVRSNVISGLYYRTETRNLHLRVK